MRSLFALTFTILLLASCSGKGAKNDVAISLTLGNVASGVPLTGGIFLSGTNGFEKFSFGTTNVDNVSIALPNGNWSISALGWKSGSGPMDGTNVCGETTINLAGGDAAVNLSLSTANCNTVAYAGPNSFDTTINDGSFKTIKFKSCLTTAGLTIGADPICDNSTLDKLIGQSAAIKIIMRGESNFPAPIGNLESACLKVDSHPTDLKGSVITSSIRLPVNVGGSVPFPIEIQGHRRVDCGAGDNGGEDDNGYIFLHGFGGVAAGQSSSSVYVGNPSYNSVYWPDNYLGYPDSAFRASGIAPIITCNGGQNCFSGNEAARDNYPVQNVKQGVWDITGTPSMINLYDEDKFGIASKTMTMGADTLTVTASSAGIAYDINFVTAGPTGGSASASVAGPVITVTAFNDATTATVVTAINALSGVVIATGTGAQTGWDNYSNQQMRFPQALVERDYGILDEVKYMLYGPMGAILHKNGLTTLAAVCGDSGSYFEDFVDEFGLPAYVSVSLSAGTVVPPDYMTTNNTTPFNKRLTFNSSDGGTMAFEFNCSGELKNGWFRQNHFDAQRDEETEVFYATQVANAEAVEVIDYEYDVNDGIRKNYKYFQKQSDTAWTYYQTSISDNYSWYSRIGGSANVTGDKIEVNQYDDNTNVTNSNVNFLGAATGNDNFYGDCFLMSTEAGSQTGCTAVVAPTGVGLADGTEYFLAPSIIPSLSTIGLDTLEVSSFFTSF